MNPVKLEANLALIAGELRRVPVIACLATETSFLNSSVEGAVESLK